jgi:uncharacterized membrane protein YdbT with pleckstrin-like domain
MSYPSELLSPEEEIVTEFRPHWTALAFPVVLGLVAVVVIVAAAVLMEATARWVVVLGSIVIWLVASIRRLATWATTQHVVTTERVIHRAGVLARRGKEIPLESINDVAFSQSIFERIVRSGDLLIESAGEMGQTRYSDIPHPERLQSLIYQVRERRIVALRGATSSVGTELERLVGLRDRGVLTDEEFEAQKRKLLGNG